VDAFSAIFGKINLNQQCGRSPDTLPFSGRRSSAMGTMSVTEALREFSVPTVIAAAAAHNEQNEDGDSFIDKINAQSKFLETMEVMVPQ
jgi:glyceraldehyde-3-phosphate dehydrogenase (NADP+)